MTDPVAWAIQYPNGLLSPYNSKLDAQNSCPKTCTVEPLYRAPVVTDEMVDRACRGYDKADLECRSGRAAMRAALEVALGVNCKEEGGP